MATSDKRFRLHHFHEWRSFYGKSCRLELWRESLNNVIPIEILQSPWSNVKVDAPANGNFDKHFPIWGSTLDFNFYEQKEDVLKGVKTVSLDSVVADFEREVRCDLYVNGDLIYRGWQAPDQCEDFPHRDNRIIYLTFIDGIGALDTFPILTTESDSIAISQASDYGYYGANLLNATSNSASSIETKVSVFNIIKLCLLKAQMDFGFKVINDIYEVGLVTADVRVFEKVLVDYLSYSKDKSSSNCAEVLTSIFRAFGLVVYQKNGYWNIVRVAYLESKLVNVEVYDKDGVFVTTVNNYKTTNTLNYLESEANTPKSWHILEDGFTRISNPPCQYQNIIYDYGEDLIVNDYDATPWIVKALNATQSTLGSDVYLKIIDETYKYPDILVSVYNAAAGDEDAKRLGKNTKMIEFIRDGVFSQEITVYPDNEITFSISGLFKKLLFFAYITDQDGIIYHFIPSLNLWVNRDLFFNSSAGATLTKTDLIASAMYLTRNKDLQDGAEGFYETKFTFSSNDSLKAFRDTGKRNKVKAFGLALGIEFEYPVIENVPCYLKTGKLTIILRGGSDSNKDTLDPTQVYVRNIKVKIDQVKETHTFTNAGKVSYKPEDITVINGDGSGTGYTTSSYFIREEIGTFPYISNPFPTKLWKDTSHQEANNLLSFTAESIVNAYAKRGNIIKAKIRTRQKLWLGDILRMPSYSKLGYGKYLIMPPFNYDVCEDIYELTLFEITCDTAKGNTLEYYLDSNGSSIFRSQTFSDGYVCPQTFELETVCNEQLFILETIC
jgi:hypothetical protein